MGFNHSGVNHIGIAGLLTGLLSGFNGSGRLGFARETDREFRLNELEAHIRAATARAEAELRARRVIVGS